MTAEITIPPEAIEAAAIVLMSRLMVSQQDALHVWSGMYEPEKEQFRRESRAACIAMLQNWPGMREESREHVTFTSQYGERRLYLILPLPQEGE